MPKNGNGSPAGEYLKVENGYLEIRQKLGAGTISASGKSKVFVSSGGFKPTDDGGYRANVVLISK